MKKPKAESKTKYASRPHIGEQKLQFWKEVATKTILPRTFSDVQCCVLNSSTVYIFQKHIDMNSTNTFAVYHIDTETIEQRKLEINGYNPVTDKVAHIYLLKHEEGIYSDYRYKVIDFDTSNNTWNVIEAIGISPKQRLDCSVVLLDKYLLLFGGMQIYPGDNTGSFIYCLNIAQKEWTLIDYEGDFPAPVPNKPFLGCRGGMSVNLIGEEKILCFGGRIGIAASTAETEYEFSSEGIGYMETADVYEFNIEEEGWLQPEYTSVVQELVFHDHSSAYDEKRNRIIIYNNSELLIELSYAAPILLQPVPERRAEIQIIEGNLYLIGIFNNSKYSIFRTELQEIKKMDGDFEEEKAPIVHSTAELFNNSLCSDRVLQVEGKNIPVHKEILARGSEAFGAMFNLIETDCFVITEFSYSVMYILLEQIYTNYAAELPSDVSIQLELLKAAIKYKLDPLIKKIEKECRISASNLGTIYESAKMIGNQELLAKCKEYAKNNWSEVQKKLTHEGIKAEIIDYMIGRNECKHEQVLLFTTGVTENTSLKSIKKSESVDLNKNDMWVLQDSTLQMKVCAMCHKVLTNNPNNSKFT